MTPTELEEKASRIDIARLRTSKTARAWLRAGILSAVFSIVPFLLMIQAANAKVWAFAALTACQLVCSLILIHVALFVHRLENIERICREESARLVQLYPSSPSQAGDNSA